MADRCWISFFMMLFCIIGTSERSAGDAEPVHNHSCSVGQRCFSNCKYSGDDISNLGKTSMQESLHFLWKQWGCQADCRYYCVVNREKERVALGHGPVNYHSKWPFKPIYGLQEPVSVAFSVLNLAMHFRGWLSFRTLLHHKLPLKLNKKPYYEYTTFWQVYGLLSINSWFWNAIFHSRDMDLAEKLDYYSAVAVIGYSLILAILRSFSVRDEASRVMVAAPLLAFVITHILFLNNFKLDHGWNMKVSVTMAIAQLLLWAIWAGVTRHPSRWKLWVVVAGGGLAMLLEIYDFPPYGGFLDAHTVWHGINIPITHLWWSFIRDDSEFRTSNLIKKAK